MDDVQVGRAMKAVRLKRGWRQRELGARAKVSQQLVSRIEHGRFDRVGLTTARRVAAQLDIAISLSARWRGGDLFQLLDSEHAALVEATVRRLRDQGWEILVEYSFNHFGERGSVDVVAWHPGLRTLLIVEVKSRIVDVQELLGTLGRKVRVVPPLLGRERGWRARSIGRLLVLPPTKRARTAVSQHAATFETALPARGPAVRRWLADPVGPLAGIWFIALTLRSGGRNARATRVLSPAAPGARRQVQARSELGRSAADAGDAGGGPASHSGHHSEEA